MLAIWWNASMEIRIAVVLMFSVLLGPFINWAIYNVAFFPRPISPWGRTRFRELEKSHPEAKPLIDRTSSWGGWHLPVFGWWQLRDESAVLGKLFWLRPLLIELLFPMFLAWLYWFEVSGGLLPRNRLPVDQAVVGWLHLQFASHALLSCLMCVATFIDFDERTIPDWITVPGTLLGLVGSILFLAWHLPIDWTHPATKAWPTALTYDAPRAFDSLVGSQAWWIAMGGFALWCFALTDRRWIMRRGLRKACLYFFETLRRNPSTKFLLLLWIVGSVGLAATWPTLSLPAQQSLLSSVIGMVLGGLTVWLIRWVAGMTLGMEALGFGDVTLMAMVGAFLGWQPAVIAFFISPILAILIVVVRYWITGDNQTPFGPYLCAGVWATLIGWDRLWNGYFQYLLDVVGPVLFQILLGALVLMGAMLWIWRLVKQTIGSRN